MSLYETIKNLQVFFHVTIQKATLIIKNKHLQFSLIETFVN